MASCGWPQAKWIYYFCDESSHLTDSDKYMGVGGLAVPAWNMRKVVQRIAAIKNGDESEIKWRNTSNNGRDVKQTLFAEYLAQLVRDGDVHLHIRFAPFDEYDHEVSGPGKRHDTTGKMYRELLIHRALKFYDYKASRLHVRPDGGEPTKRLNEFRASMLTRAMRQYKERVHRDCLLPILPLESERQPMLQLLDVTLGAFVASRNDRPNNGPKFVRRQNIWDRCGGDLAECWPHLVGRF